MLFAEKVIAWIEKGSPHNKGRYLRERYIYYIHTLSLSLSLCLSHLAAIPPARSPAVP